MDKCELCQMEGLGDCDHCGWTAAAQPILSYDVRYFCSLSIKAVVDRLSNENEVNGLGDDDATYLLQLNRMLNDWNTLQPNMRDLFKSGKEHGVYTVKDWRTSSVPRNARGTQVRRNIVDRWVRRVIGASQGQHIKTTRWYDPDRPTVMFVKEKATDNIIVCWAEHDAYEQGIYVIHTNLLAKDTNAYAKAIEANKATDKN